MKLNATRETCLAMEILSTFHTHILSVFAGNKQPSFAIVRILETKITLKNKVCLGLACALSYFFLQFLGQSDVIVAISGVVGFLFYNISFIALPPAHPTMPHMPPPHLLILRQPLRLLNQMLNLYTSLVINHIIIRTSSSALGFARFWQVVPYSCQIPHSL